MDAGMMRPARPPSRLEFHHLRECELRESAHVSGASPGAGRVVQGCRASSGYHGPAWEGRHARPKPVTECWTRVLPHPGFLTWEPRVPLFPGSLTG